MHYILAFQLAFFTQYTRSLEPSATQNTTAFALTYGYPLLVFESNVNQAAKTGVNQIKNDRLVCTPELCPTTVRPDVDTLYSTMVWDLSHDDIVIHYPDGIPDDQFVLFSFFDPYGDNFANVGSLNLHSPGLYRLRPSPGDCFGITEQYANSSGYQAYIDSPSLYGYLIARWLVNATDIRDLYEWQDRTIVQNISQAVRGPALLSLPKLNQTATLADNVLNLLAAFSPYTRPTNISDTKRVANTLAAAGIENGTFTLQPGVNLTAANTSAVAAAYAAAAAPSSNEALSNGWTAVNPRLEGRFGSSYALRESVGNQDYLALTAPNRLYPSWANESSSKAGATPAGMLSLGANESYLYTFGSKPPLEKTGFWSLTSYANNVLVHNRYNISHVSSASSNLTYPDGTLVYGSNTSDAEDGGFQVLVQAADNPPPSNWTGNWLPGPAEGGNLSVSFRVYDPQRAVIDGEWSFPVVTKQSCIAAG